MLLHTWFQFCASLSLVIEVAAMSCPAAAQSTNFYGIAKAVLEPQLTSRNTCVTSTQCPARFRLLEF